MHDFILAFGLSDIDAGEIVLVALLALLMFGKEWDAHCGRIKDAFNKAKWK